MLCENMVHRQGIEARFFATKADVIITAPSVIPTRDSGRNSHTISQFLAFVIGKATLLNNKNHSN